MKKLDKFIKLACLSALILTIFSVGWFFCRNISFTDNLKIDLFSPFKFNKKTAAVIAEAENYQTVKMLFVGDIMLDRHVKEKIEEKNLAYLFDGFKAGGFDFRQYDLVNANLEGAVTDSGAHYAPAYSYDFAFAPELIGELKNYNFKIFNLANNHLTDQGERGVVETGINLAKLGYKYYGCQDAQAGDCSATIYEARGFKIGFAGFSMVYKEFNQAEAEKIIAELKNKTDLTVVSIHWGKEYEHIFNGIQESIAHKFIDAGADIIVGHHPHVVQGVEIYETKRAAANGAHPNELIRRPIFYSLGNFIFDQYFSRDTQEELAIELDWNAAGQGRVILYPLISRQSQPSLMAGEARRKYLEKIAGWSKGDSRLMEGIKKGELSIDF
ncbi:MAG: CapA family protein [Patescibacteria group bacterium]|nr:CapA family protein [Patescibacteria group bacterium]